MKSDHFTGVVAALIFLALMLSLAGCVPLTPLPLQESLQIETEVPPTDIPREALVAEYPILLHFPDGDASINDVLVSESYPEGCDSTSCMFHAPPKRILVVVLLRLQDGLSEDALADELGNAANRPNIFITDAAGNKNYIQVHGKTYDKTVNGVRYYNYLAAFAPLASQSDFTLYWGDNEPIELGD